jgi:hypothetical protein
MPAIDDALAAGPISTLGFGPREAADETRQAQQAFANDMPVDVNVNAVVARDQTLTFDVLGKNYEGNADRRTKLFDHFAAKMGSA